MASLTVRKLDEALKASLRLRAAKAGRSVEDEVRMILREAAEPQAVKPPSGPAPNQPHRARASSATDLPRVTLIIGGGIAAYKALDLIRRLKERGIHVRCVMTRAAQQFVTPLTAGALADERCYTDLFDAQSEFDAGHIRLARDTDLIIVAPATADLMSKLATGAANDLASAVLLATDKPVLMAPAM
ncbi:MAG: flavoprotein, partial [Afipia sp.]|nr:flavoprotein [Afipia sp.]